MTLANAAISAPKLRHVAAQLRMLEWMDGHFALFMQRQGSKQIDNFIGKTCNEMSKMAKTKAKRDVPVNFR